MCDLFLNLLSMRFTSKYVCSWTIGPLIGPLEPGSDLASLTAGMHKTGVYRSEQKCYMEKPVIIYLDLSNILSIRSSVPAVKEDWQGRMAPSQYLGRCVLRWALSALTVCCCHTESGRSSLWVSLYLEKDERWENGPWIMSFNMVLDPLFL